MVIGDVYAVPIKNGNYGIIQIVRKAQPNKKYGDCFAVVFDIELSYEELNDFDFLSLYTIKIFLGIPMFLSPSKKLPLYWQILINIPVVNYDPPMFIMPGMPHSTDGGYTVIVDFNCSYYRYVRNDEATKMSNYYVATDRRLESVLYTRFVDKSYYPETVKDLENLSNHISERDMSVNKDQYMRWTGFDSIWKDYDKKLMDLKTLTEQFDADVHVNARIFGINGSKAT